MDDQTAHRANGGIVNQRWRSAPRKRILAAVLLLIWAALMALLFYLESTGGVDHWPVWTLWVAGVACGLVLIALQFLIVIFFFGLQFRGRDRQFTLRKMMLAVLCVSIVVWYVNQMEWIKQRRAWRHEHQHTATSTPGQAPLGLLRLLDTGASRIEIASPSEEQIAEAQRLFPEAIIVKSGEVPDE